VSRIARRFAQTRRRGLVVILPLIGHMTWHAYRESVAPRR
jgi:uncharacterized membrane protein